ncbi:ATP-binding response regulator [sulfur-oxidizing endosymbiont of Gigantopelta aegis]|uniref:ATP-binding response regulator n=1 Tax=sulfur-oxidizing endosymbiont of Gigantopelta aegis TaxID=2794934 RepID=UPI0018DDB4BD|nr:response regulator [sulfur-oxidizing endosymbiont of Gigantopelta aegis]
MNSMGFNNGSILIVEDDPLMSDLLTLYLRQEDYKCISVSSSEDAWLILSDKQYTFDCVLLDINLPGMSGIELLKKIKADSRLYNLPVIMETADNSNESILEGMNNGAYYYLTKPVVQEKLIALLKVAVGDFRRNAYLQKEVKSISSIFKNCQEGRFYFKTLLDCQRLAVALANMFPDPERVISGLSELMMNAVEHGNLEIGYETKSSLLAKDYWIDEIDERLDDKQYACRQGEILLLKSDNKIVVTISDQGKGFDWQPYLQLSIERIFDQHGRGIAATKERCFDELEYQGNGSTVVGTVFL